MVSNYSIKIKLVSVNPKSRQVVVYQVKSVLRQSQSNSRNRQATWRDESLHVTMETFNFSALQEWAGFEIARLTHAQCLERKSEGVSFSADLRAFWSIFENFIRCNIYDVCFFDPDNLLYYILLLLFYILFKCWFSAEIFCLFPKKYSALAD